MPQDIFCLMSTCHMLSGGCNPMLCPFFFFYPLQVVKPKTFAFGLLVSLIEPITGSVIMERTLGCSNNAIISDDVSRVSQLYAPHPP